MVQVRKTKEYESICFSADVLREALQELRCQVDTQEEGSELSYALHVEVDDAEWQHDSLEEFLADYRRATGKVFFKADYRAGHFTSMLLSIYGRDNNRDTRVEVSASDRSRVEAVFEVFEKHVEHSKLPADSPRTRPMVFIGHGHSPLWRDLKDHLQDQHGYDVEAYEVGARAGHVIRDILEDMLEKSTFAILVMTGEDETKNNEFQPRLNVVHELGLFQGRLGFSRAIMLFENETQEFSNIHGVHQVRFSKGRIKETFGDVLATLRREFPEIAS